jgi:hypothetical protein
MNTTKSNFLKVVKKSVSKSEVCRALGWPVNGTGLRKFNECAKKYGADVSHFSQKAVNNKYNRKYESVEKICPVCKAVFTTNKGHAREKTTCSLSCSNTYFRSGENNPNWKDERSDWGYRKLCFSRWPKKCILCNFDMVVEVHHLDENHHNNDESNLVPLCPNHHRAIHTKKFGQAVKNQIQVVLTGTSS